MAFEKAKVLKAAEKFLSQGKIPAAIKEYRQIVDNDPDDHTALNMLGDLFARAGDKEEAVNCFLQIADHFREQGFATKAIAMYKKIEKLKPRDPATANALADLYANQGLIVDARAQYLVVSEAYIKAGDTKRSLKVLHKIADLDAHNTEVRLKLAEGYLRENMQQEAARAFTEAAQRMFENGDFDRSLAAFSRARELRPNDRGVLKGLVSAHTALGAADDAAELLEKALADGADDPEIASMLAQAYIDAEDAAGAELITARIVEADSREYRRYTEVARLYLKIGSEDDAARVLGMITETMLAAREENDLLELVDEVLARAPEQVASLRLLARIYWWQRDNEKLRSTLERLAESSETAGLEDDERYALTQLVRLAPDEPRFLERLTELGGFADEISEEAELATPPTVPEVPSFDSFEIMGEPSSEAAAAQPPVTSPSDEFEWNSVSEEPSDPSASFADLNETDEIENSQAGKKLVPDTSSPGPASSLFKFEDNAEQPVTEDGRVAPNVESLLQQELESVDFYINQGYSDIALDTLELLERQVGPHPEITARREKLAAGGQGVPAADTFSAGSEVLTSGSRIEPETELTIDVSFGDLNESKIKPVQTQMADPAPAEFASGIDSGLAEIFEEFRIEAEEDDGVPHGDFETHYNMATAYQEMELLDEAIREFQAAAGLISPADGTARYFQCCNMLGHCFVKKDMPQAAVIWFKKGLESPGRSTEEYTALQYELGSAYEHMGDLTRAEGVFTEVYGVDVRYRDVAERLQAIQVRKTEKKKKKR
ncbi:MAG TPA: tetratricopeptide repeat protein [Pyrinomonadaceae bacterium]|nr:tetratricopeptide repeat protein [Pyrinomonadaceae bacterium]